MHKEFWPFVHKMETIQYRCVGLVRGRGSIPLLRYERTPFCVNGKEDLDFRYCHIFEDKLELNVCSYEVFDNNFDYIFRFNIGTLHTKGGVVLRELEDIKSFLLK